MKPVVIAVLLIATHLSAQNPQFEVASIRVNQSGANSSSVDTQPSGRLTFVNETLRVILQRAYQVQPFQIVGGPDWINATRFDIAAKAPAGVQFQNPVAGDPPPIQLMMLRSLLEDRFRLRTRVEHREMPVLAISLARADGQLGPKLKKSARDCESPSAGCRLVAGDGEIVGQGRSMTQLTAQLSRLIGRVVIDKTGLTGSYDFDLRFTTEAVPNSDYPALATALVEQLGIRMEPGRHLQDFIVIDHVESPSPD